MALAKDKKLFINVFGLSSSSSSAQASSDLSSPKRSLKLTNLPMSGSSSLLSSPISSTNSNGHIYGGQPEEAHSVINFKTTGYHHFTGSFLNFDHQDDHDHYGKGWEDSLHVQGYDQLHPKYAPLNPRLSHDFNSVQSSGSYGSTMIESINEISLEANLEANATTTNEERCFNKRPSKEESTQGDLKRHCNGSSSTKIKQQQQPKPKSSTPSKDPQSLAAKNRRERISEKLKTLQELVPNGSKVDLVTMLDKAITYVKFLQVQVKVLATDEFWPAQGAKAPELSQVQEAIDAILSSSKHKTNSSIS